MSAVEIVFENPSYDLELRLSVSGYQFPAIETDYDGNWLNINMECRHRGESFSREFPCLLTKEITDVSRWFLDISSNEIPRWVSHSFIEPNLEFQLYSNNDGIIRFGIHLSKEFKPPFRVRELSLDDDDPDEGFAAIFEYPLEAMRGYGQQFAAWSDAYPQRGSLASG